MDKNNEIKIIQDHIYRIICDIDDYCRKNEIRYMLSGGTCLGAVRHKDFIPWDDDADIMMRRSDYEKFIRGFGEAFPDKYGAGSCEIDREWKRSWGRVWDKRSKITNKIVNDKEIGFFVDVFPIDGVPDGKFREKLFYKKIKALEVIKNSIIRKNFIEDESHKTLKKFIHIFTKKIDPTKIVKRINTSAMKYRFESSRNVAVSMVTHYGSRETIARECMENTVEMQFRDRMFPIPIGYDKYLTNLYGDYMKIPEDVDTHVQFWEISVDDETIVND